MKRTTRDSVWSFAGPSVPCGGRAHGNGRGCEIGRGHAPGRRVRVAALVAAACLALAAVLVGCGGGGSDTNGLESVPAADLGDRVADALRGADSVHVVGAIEYAGRAGSSYDLRLTGQSATGTIVRDGHEHEIVKVGDETYVRGDAGYWEFVNEAEAADLLAGNWVRVSQIEVEQEYRSYTLEGFALAVAQYTQALGDPVTQATLGDAAVVTASAPGGSTLWASNTGAGYPLRLDISGSDTGKMEFSDYDAELTITAPAGAIEPPARLG